MTTMDFPAELSGIAEISSDNFSSRDGFESVINTRDSGDFKTNLAAEKLSTTKLFHYLCENIEKITNDGAELEKFEEMTAQIERKDGSGTELMKVLKTFGWNSKHYKEPYEFDDISHALANLYISQNHGFGARVGETMAELIDRPITPEETILSFIPNILLSHLAIHIPSEEHEGASTSAFVGAAMLADISGFSKYAATQCSRGVNGLDDLHETTNGFLAHYVSLVHRYGGDVVAFAGDALVCIFQENETSKADAEKDSTHIDPAQFTRRNSSVQYKPIIPDLYFELPACVRALQCGLAMKNHKHAALFTHIAVGYGEMKFSVLGGHNSEWTFLVNGPCISELAGCITDAQAQDLVCTAKCYEQLGDDLAMCTRIKYSKPRNKSLSPEDIARQRGRSFRSEEFHRVRGISGDADDCFIDDDDRNVPGKPLTMLPAVARDNDEVIDFLAPFDGAEAKPCPSKSGNILILNVESGLQPPSKLNRLSHLLDTTNSEIVNASKLFVPAPVLTAVYSDSLDKISELRHVTTMFLSLDSYSPEKHSDPVSLQPFFYMMQAILHQTGGYLRQFIVDDKGCAVIAMWGVPSFSYSSNSARGVYCAVATLVRAASMGMICSVGVTTGNVFCGTVGSSERKDYVVIGNEVNMAARLMCKAHGKVFIDRVTYMHLSKTTKSNFFEGEALVLKGAPAPVVPYVNTSYSMPDPTMLEEYDDNKLKSSTLRKQVRVTLGNQLDKISNMSSSKVTDILAASGLSMKHVSLHRSSLNPQASTLKSCAMSPDVRARPAPNAGAVFTIVSGNPGTGKSTAAEYFLQHAQRRGLSCFSVKCRYGDENIPYAVLRKLFLEIVGEANFKDEKSQRVLLRYLLEKLASNALSAGVTFDKRACMNTLQSILCSTGSGDARTSMDSSAVGDGGAREAFDSAFSDKKGMINRVQANDHTYHDVLVAILRNKRSVIVLDDVNYCDELSWQQLYQVLDGDVLPAAFLLTYTTPLTRMKAGSSTGEMTTRSSGGRIFSSLALAAAGAPTSSRSNNGEDSRRSSFNESNSSFMMITNHEKCVMIEMTALNIQEVRDVLSASCNINELTPELIASVHDVTAGNAFWCKKVAQYIKENGVAAFAGAIGRREGKHNSLKALILSRVDMLSGDQLVMAKLASIIGDEFSVEELKAVLPSKLHQAIGKNLIAIKDNGLIAMVCDIDSIYAFQNQLVRNTLYDLTPPSDAASTHLAIAEHLEKKFASNLDKVYPLLSYHFNHGHNRDLGLKYTCKAARQVIRKGAFNRGYTYLITAVPLCSSRSELRVLLSITNFVLKEIMPKGIGKLVRRMSSFSTVDKYAEENLLRTDYLNLKADIEKSIEQTSDNATTIAMDVRKMTMSTKVTNKIDANNHMLVISRQPSAMIARQSSDASLELETPKNQSSSFCTIS